MASDDLRARIAEIRTGMTETYLTPPSDVRWLLGEVERLQAELDREQETSQLLMDQRQQMAAERYVWQESGDRYRLAWQSARQRAQAYGEGIVRLCGDRDSYKGWMDEQAERAARAEQELATVRAALAKRDKRIEEYRESRQRWMEAAYADRRASNQAAAERDAALAALQAVREAQSLGEALAAVAKHDGLTHNLVAEPFTPPPGAAVCLICRQWDQDFAKHTRCPNCGQSWNAQSTTKE